MLLITNVCFFAEAITRVHAQRDVLPIILVVLLSILENNMKIHRQAYLNH